jgi:hypothetical protein
LKYFNHAFLFIPDEQLVVSTDECDAEHVEMVDGCQRNASVISGRFAHLHAVLF